MGCSLVSQRHELMVYAIGEIVKESRKATVWVPYLFPITKT